MSGCVVVGAIGACHTKQLERGELRIAPLMGVTIDRAGVDGSATPSLERRGRWIAIRSDSERQPGEKRGNDRRIKVDARARVTAALESAVYAHHGTANVNIARSVIRRAMHTIAAYTGVKAGLKRRQWIDIGTHDECLNHCTGFGVITCGSDTVRDDNNRRAVKRACAFI